MYAMATESTAIVNLVDLVKNNKPLPRDAGDDLLFGGGARFDPLAMDIPAAAAVTLPTAPARTPSGTRPPPSASAQRAPSVVLPRPFLRQPAHAIERTIRVPRSLDPNVRRFALPVGLFVVAMILLSIYLAKGDKKAPKAAIVPAPAPAAQMPVLTPPPAPAPAPVAVVAAQAEPVAAAKAEPVVTPIASPTVEPIDSPAAAQPTVPTVPAPTVPTVPDAPVAAADDAPVAAPAQPSKRHREHHRAAKRAKTGTRVAVAEKSANLRGKGALVLSSSPSREIWIDGRKTKQMTPQRLTLAPGTHNVTLFDKKTRSAKTFQVEIKPNQTLKVAKAY
jgi:hypothetical protein